MKIAKYLVPWFFTFITMFGMSYAWHAMFLNDLALLHYPATFFVMLLAIVYSIVAFIIVFCASFFKAKRSNLINGTKIGIIVGFVIYLLVFTLGISFTGGSSNKEYIIVDFVWQMIEEGAGGFICGGVYGFFMRLEKFTGRG